MVYTEIKERGKKKYYYRVKSVRMKGKVTKKRVYLGVNMKRDELGEAEKKADRELESLSSLLTDKEIEYLNNLKERYGKEPKENFDSRYESFCSQFTYNSTAIEGNTLTLQETAQLLFDSVVPASKSLREINEVLNHRQAFDYILSYKGDLNRNFILELHRLVVKDTLKAGLESQSGAYRMVQVYIKGVDWLPSKPSEVPSEMASLLSWYTRARNKIHPLIMAAYFHSGFETIHPFVDGNGRVGRLLMNFILHRNGYPMINIPNARKAEYYSALQKSQIEGNLKPLVDLLINILKDAKILI